MPRDMEAVFRKIVETLRREYDPDKIIVFGSHARGEASEDSDVDLFVVKRTDKPVVERIVEVSRLLREVQTGPLFIPLDILVSTPEEVHRRLQMGDSFYHELLREGRVLYDPSARNEDSTQEARHVLAPCRHCHG